MENHHFWYIGKKKQEANAIIANSVSLPEGYKGLDH